MSTPNPYESIVRFSTFELDFSGRVLRKSGLRVRCQEQPLQVLAALLEKPGVLITRDELRQRVWSEDTFVDFDHALNTAVKKLRSVLSDDADAPRYIETVPRRGYRFIGGIQPGPQAVPAAQSTAKAFPTVVATKSPPLKYQHAILVGVLGVILAFAAIYYLNSHRAKASGSLPFVKPAMLAVLPFQNMTSDPGQESFSDGMTEETTTRLARLNSSRFHVIARTSAMKYKGAGKGIDEISRELHADYLLEGSIRREGKQVRISCQLIRAADQAPQWTQEFNFDSGDSLELETRAAETIATQLNSIIGDPNAPARPMMDHAFDSYLRGLAESSIHTPEGLDRIIAAFQKAVVDDPNCSQPLAGLAHVYERGTNLGFLPPRATYAKAREAAEQAIKIDPSNPEPYVYLADAVLTVDYDWKGAQAEIQKALDLNANDPMAHEWNGVFLSIQGKHEAAIEEMRRAVELDPLNADRKVFLGKILQLAGQREEAEEEMKAALELDPASTIAHAALMMLYDEWGRQSDAVGESSAIFFLEGKPEAADAVRSIYRKSGYEAAKRYRLKAQLAYLTRLREQRYVSAYAFASIHAQLGEKEEAVEWLQKSYAARDVELPCLPSHKDEVFDSIQDDPRVVAILEKVRPPQ
jgi:TolB-like protein/DNA-binding winged helix-turn-helix (wHTH) protein/Flp pilus assembly protein TadD